MSAPDPADTLSGTLAGLSGGPGTSPMAVVPTDSTYELYEELAVEIAALDGDPYPAAPVPYNPHQAHRDGQVHRAFEYLDQRRSWADDVAQRRAAVILNAQPYAPMAEQTMGIRATWGPTPTDVTCRACGDTWACILEDPLYEPLAEGGLCFRCVLTETRSDAQDHVLEGVIVAGDGA